MSAPRIASVLTVDHRIPSGPFFDELAVGQAHSSPGLTLTDALVATHRAIVGDRTPIALDTNLATRVTGGRAVAHPALIWDVVIGQSTHFTQRAKANLFYRNLALRRLVEVGDTIYTDTEVVALRENSAKEGRHPTGMVVLRITAVDQEGRAVMDFSRCAMLPMSRPEVTTGHQDDLLTPGDAVDVDQLRGLVASWDLTRHPQGPAVRQGDRFIDGHGDVVSSAPELARTTLNLAAVHHDSRAAGKQRLVYGGHTVGLANAQLAKAFPHLVAVIGWNSCDHLGPVHENDTVFSTITVENVDDIGAHGQFVDFRCQVFKVVDGPPVEVLDWRPRALLALR
ncbi:MaoC family dehydratase [Rhodococcus pyridinivorans]|uniref:MaoC family dehydratase n=1 Tax=Rhodococcus pyridinivorans TaxID=103816 RepID=UPI003434A422